MSKEEFEKIQKEKAAEWERKEQGKSDKATEKKTRPDSGKVFKGNFLKNLKMALKAGRLLSPSTYILFGLDWAVTGAIFYGSTYLILNHSLSFMNNVYLSPGDLIKNVLYSEGDVNHYFVHATREHLYPLCAHLAEISQFQFEEESPFKKDRKQACKNLIMGLDGLTEDQFIEKYPSIAKSLDMNQGEYALMDSEGFQRLLESTRKYPLDYRVYWMAALRSMYNLDIVSKQYWEVAGYLIGGSRLFTGSATGALESTRFFGAIGEEAQAEINLARFNYAIHLLAVNAEIKRAVSDLSTAEEGPVTLYSGPSDPSLVKNVASLEGAFLSYVRFHVEDLRAKKDQLNESIAEVSHDRVDVESSIPTGISSFTPWDEGPHEPETINVNAVVRGEVDAVLREKAIHPVDE